MYPTQSVMRMLLVAVCVAFLIGTLCMELAEAGGKHGDIVFYHGKFIMRGGKSKEGDIVIDEGYGRR